MNRSSWLLALYPPAWRERYGEEFAALLEARRLTPGDWLDTLCGALDTRLHWPDCSGGRQTMRAPLRLPVLSVFCAYIAFVIGGLLLYGTADDSPFVPALATHPALAAAWYLLEAGAVVALLTVVAGGLPIACVVGWHGLTRARWPVLALLAVPPLMLLVLIGYVAGVALLFAAAMPAHSVKVALAAGWVLLAPSAALASTAAACAAVVRTPVGEHRVRFGRLLVTVVPYRFALTAAMVVAAIMAAMTVVALCWVLLARAAAPQGFAGMYGVFGTPTALSLFASVTLMALATGVAASAVVRGRHSGAHAVS